MSQVVVTNCPEPDESILPALDAVAAELGIWTCWLYLERFHFAIGGGWTIAISEQSAGRLCVEACWHCRPRTTMWALSGTQQLARLAGLARRMSIEARQPA